MAKPLPPIPVINQDKYTKANYQLRVNLQSERDTIAILLQNKIIEGHFNNSYITTKCRCFIYIHSDDELFVNYMWRMCLKFKFKLWKLI